jgi:hypothetical protein
MTAIEITADVKGESLKKCKAVTTNVVRNFGT